MRSHVGEGTKEEPSLTVVLEEAMPNRNYIIHSSLKKSTDGDSEKEK